METLTHDERYLYTEMADRCCTTSYRDRFFQSVILRSAKNDEQRREIQRIIMDARARWMVWVTVTQRKWMANTSRRPNRGRHHDSWAIREKYVKC